MDRGWTHAELHWTLGTVEVVRYDVGDGRTLSLRATDPDMADWNGTPQTQAVCLQELDELIEVLQAHRDWLDHSKNDPVTHLYPNDPTNNYKIVGRAEPDEGPDGWDDLGWDVYFTGDEHAPAVEAPVGMGRTYTEALDIIEEIEDHRGNTTTQED